MSEPTEITNSNNEKEKLFHKYYPGAIAVLIASLVTLVGNKLLSDQQSESLKYQADQQSITGAMLAIKDFYNLANERAEEIQKMAILDESNKTLGIANSDLKNKVLKLEEKNSRLENEIKSIKNKFTLREEDFSNFDSIKSKLSQCSSNHKKLISEHDSFKSRTEKRHYDLSNEKLVCEQRLDSKIMARIKHITIKFHISPQYKDENFFETFGTKIKEAFPNSTASIIDSMAATPYQQACRYDDCPLGRTSFNISRRDIHFARCENVSLDKVEQINNKLVSFGIKTLIDAPIGILEKCEKESIEVYLY